MDILTKEEKHMDTKIRLFEDMLIRSNNVEEITTLRSEIIKMRTKLIRMQYQRLGGGNPLIFFAPETLFHIFFA